MTTFVLGSGMIGFSMGFADHNGRSMPFFAVADISAVAEMGKVAGEFPQDDATIQRIVDAFDKHGTVVFFDNYEEAEDFTLLITKLLNLSVDTPWFNADANSGGMQ